MEEKHVAYQETTDVPGPVICPAHSVPMSIPEEMESKEAEPSFKTFKCQNAQVPIQCHLPGIHKHSPCPGGFQLALLQREKMPKAGICSKSMCM